MSGRFSLLRDTRHLQGLLLVLLIVGGSVGYLRTEMVPETWGQRGPYRADALKVIASQPVGFPTDAQCLKCHDSVREERAESPHKSVACAHCHGHGHQHMAQAEKAATDGTTVVENASAWDRDFFTKQDLYITRDRATCLSCHERVVGMPATFRSIHVKSHLEEQGAENADSPEVCFECHTGHSPGI